MSLPITIGSHGGGVCGRRHWASWGYWSEGQERQVYEQMMASGDVNRSIHIEVVLTLSQCQPHRLELLKTLGYVLTEVFVNDNSRNTLFVFTRVKKRLPVAEWAKKIKWDGMVQTPDLGGTLPKLVLPEASGTINPFGKAVAGLLPSAKKVERTELQKAILADPTLQDYVKRLLACRDAIANLEGQTFTGNYFGGDSGYVQFEGGAKSVYLETLSPNNSSYTVVGFPTETVDDDFVLKYIFKVLTNNRPYVANLGCKRTGQRELTAGMSRYLLQHCSRFYDKLTTSGRPSTKSTRMEDFEKLMTATHRVRNEATRVLENLIRQHGTTTSKGFLERLARITPQVHSGKMEE